MTDDRTQITWAEASALAQRVHQESEQAIAASHARDAAEYAQLTGGEEHETLRTHLREARALLLLIYRNSMDMGEVCEVHHFPAEAIGAFLVKTEEWST